MLALALLVVLVPLQSEPRIVFRPAEGRILIDGHASAPARYRSHERAGLSVGRYFLSSDGKTLSAQDRWEEKTYWSVALRGGEDENVLVCGPERLRCASGAGDLLTIELASGATARTPLASVLEAREGERVVPNALLEMAGGVVLGASCVPDDEPFGAATAWIVTGLSADLSVVRWTRRVEAGAPSPRSSAALYAAQEPFQAGPSSGLDRLGDDVLFADAGGTIVRLDGRTGEERRRLERVWEFERGFVGPSSWCHCLARFGDCESFLEKDNDPPELAERRAAFEREHTGYLVAGPYVVGNDRVLVTAARAPRSEWGPYLAEAWVYELDDKLEPLSLSSLPFLPLPGVERVVEGALLLGGEGASLVQLDTSEEDPRLGFGSPGGYDARLAIAWMRRLKTEQAPVWMRFASSMPFPILGASQAVLLGGATLSEPEVHEFRFPITRLDYASGLVGSCMFVVPFEGRIDAPKTNYSSTTDAQGNQRFEVMTPCPAPLVGQIEDDELVLTLYDARGESELAFPLSALAPGTKKAEGR